MSDDDKGFVNRHGRRADLNRIDLKDISIDDEKQTDSFPAASSTAPQLSKTQRARFVWTRRKIYIASGIAVIVLALPVIIGELVTLRYNAGAGGVHDNLARVVRDKVIPAQKKATIRPDTIREAAQEIDNLRASICDGGLVDNVAQLYPRAKAAHQNCIQKAEQLSDLSSSLKRLEGQARYADSLLTAMKLVTAPSTEPYAVISSQLQNWQSTRDKVNKLAPPNEWKAKQTTLATLVNTAADGWSALNIAQNNQNKAGFEAAEKSLTTAYEGIRTTVNELIGQMYQTQNNVTTIRKSLQV